MISRGRVSLFVLVVGVLIGTYVGIFLSGWGFNSFQGMDGHPYGGGFAHAAAESAMMLGGVIGIAIACGAIWLAVKIYEYQEKTSD